MTDEQFKSVMEHLTGHFEKMDKIREWQENHDKTSIEWRDSLDTRMKPVEDFVKNLSWVYKFLLSLSLFIGTILKVWDWFRAHYK